MKIRSLMLATAATASIAGGSAASAATHHHAHKAAAAAPQQSAATKELMDEVQALKAQVESLQDRIDQQGQYAAEGTAQVQAASAKADAAQLQIADQQKKVEKLEHPDKFAFKGITITPGGYLELAGIYRDRSMTNDIATGFNSIPFDNSRTGRAHETRFSARQSRVSFLAEGDASKQAHLAMYGEFDFQGAAQTANSNESNSYNPRIRNLYGTLDYKGASGNGLHLLVGQNWSLLTMSSKGITPRNEVTPPQIDAQYVPGFAWARQPQIRLVGDFADKHLWVGLSVENPQTTVYTNGTPRGATVLSAGTAASLPGTLVYNQTGGSGFNSANTLSLNNYPDVIGKIAYEGTIGGRTLHAEGFGLFRSFYDRVGGKNDNESGYGVGGGVALQLMPGLLDAQVTGLYGKGVGRYGSSQLPDVTFNPGGHMSPVREYMLLAGLTAHATKMLDIYGFAGEEVSKGRYFTTSTGALYGYGNPLYTNAGCEIEGSAVCTSNTKSIRQATVGLWQKLYQGPFGRFQIGAQYSYTERKLFEGLGPTGARGYAPIAKQNIGFVSFRYYPF